MTDNEEPIKDEEKKETDPESTSTEQPESTPEEQKKEEEKPEEKVEEKVEEKAEEKPEEKLLEEPKELTKEDIITILKTFPGVGQVTAERIYNAGHDSRENLQKASAADLQKVRGIGKALAEQIASGLETAIKRFDKPESEKAAGEKVPGITEKTLGFIKGTVSKITGFFKGKSPKPKPKPAGEGGAVKVEGAPETRDVGEVKTADAAAASDGAGVGVEPVGDPLAGGLQYASAVPVVRAEPRPPAARAGHDPMTQSADHARFLPWWAIPEHH